MKLLSAISFLLLMTGCSANQIGQFTKDFDKSSGQVSTGLIAIKTSANAGKASLKVARPHADAVGQGAIDAADRNLDEIVKEEEEAEQSNADEAATFKKLAGHDAATTTENTKMKTWWIGYRPRELWRGFKWWAGGTFILLIILIAISTFNEPLKLFLDGAWRFICGICKVIGHVLTLGVLKIREKLMAYFQTRAATAAKVADIHAVLVNQQAPPSGTFSIPPPAATP